MNFTKEDVCVFIENEAQLEEARELLEKHGKTIDEDSFYLSENVQYNYMYNAWGSLWALGECTEDEEPRITLSELETILKQQ